jgi:hypothetical protein
MNNVNLVHKLPTSHRLFIDESGDPSLSSINADFPVFVLLGCLFEESDYLDICKRISDLKKEIFGNENVILHSRDIRKCEGVFTKLFDLKLKAKFYESLNSILENSKYIVIAVAIKKQEFIDKYGKIADDPYELSLSFLLERAVMETDSEKNGGMHITIESRGKVEDEIIQKRYNRLLDKGSGHIVPDRFKKRFQKMEFRRKKENDCGLQVADLCAYPVARHIINPKEPYPAYDIVEKKFRKNKLGSFAGYGLKVFP